MRIIFYNYYLPYRTFFKDSDEVETFSDFKTFRKNWKSREKCIIIIPVQTFDLIGLDIRFVFRKYGKDNTKKFLLIGDRKQIEFALSQNDEFLQNIISEIQLPHCFETLEETIKAKINILKNKQKRG